MRGQTDTLVFRQHRNGPEAVVHGKGFRDLAIHDNRFERVMR